jgi:hypothetical protein
MAIETGRAERNIRIACQKFGLRTPNRSKGREMSFQLRKTEAMNLNPGGTPFDSRERDMVVKSRSR